MGIVYMIKCNETGECYIGSANTKKCYSERRSCHKTKGGSSSKQIIERCNYTFSIVEENIFIDSELRQREQYWIDTSDHVINKNRAYRTEEQKKEDQKEWREKHKEDTAEYNKEYNEKNKEQICLKQQEYYEKNKETKKQYDQLYYIQNKGKLNEKFTCECGGKYSRVNKLTHFKTKKHQNYLIELL